MQTTKIEWTDKSWNPVTGCLNGCEYCYAARISHRFGRSFEPALHPSRLSQPRRLRTPSKIFVCSMADLFGDWVPQTWIDLVMDVVRTNPQHTFQFLTKNPKRLPTILWPHNAWVGATAVNQGMADNAMMHLQSVKASVKFLSVEPMLRPVRLERSRILDWVIIGAMTGPGRKQPDPEWVRNITKDARASGAAVFYKPNLIWDNAPREFPNE